MVKATKKQKDAFKEVLKGETVSSAMKKAGYSPVTVEKPKNLTETKGWKSLMETYLPDETLMKVHKQGLKATDPKSVIIGYEASPIKGGKSVPQVKIMNSPDHAVRHRYLETAYKIKGKFAENNIGIAVQINFKDPDLQ